MNAAIEAAHAGESGKGFAVVADENSMNEMAAAAFEINNSSKEVSDISQKNKNNIDQLSIEVNKFKV